MSAQIRILQNDEAEKGFELLKYIVGTIKNPKEIEQAYEARRKAVQLSDDEVRKSEEARSVISKADELRASLKQEEKRLSAIAANNDKIISSHAENVKRENIRLTELEGNLNIISAKHAQTEEANIEAKKNIDKRSKEIEDSHTEWLKKYNDKVAEQKAIDESQRKEAERLQNFDKKLRAKAARLAAEAASE